MGLHRDLDGVRRLLDQRGLPQPRPCHLPQVRVQGPHPYGALCCVLGGLKSWCHLLSLRLASRWRSYCCETSLKTSQFGAATKLQRQQESLISFHQPSPPCEKLCPINPRFEYIFVPLLIWNYQYIPTK